MNYEKISKERIRRVKKHSISRRGRNILREYCRLIILRRLSFPMTMGGDKSGG